MFKFDNTHIFTGYLKQLLSSFNLPMCRVYTKDFMRHLERFGAEDPRILESFDTILFKDSQSSKYRTASYTNYLKGNEVVNYYWGYSQDKPEYNHANCTWKPSKSIYYHPDRFVPGLTKTLDSPGIVYDSITHEYLGDYLRFIRDYYDINLMSLYNCFNNKICNNLYYKEKSFDSRDKKYRIYAIPVKLFSEYTIAIDCSQEVELFCGFYNTTLYKSEDLFNKTYQRVNGTFFGQPFLYDKLSVKNWTFEADCAIPAKESLPALFSSNKVTRWDIANREQDLRLFIKVPASCKSSITILEGDFRTFNNCIYTPVSDNTWEYKQNHFVLNFDDGVPINESPFIPIGKLQLLAFNTGESYPFADRLVEYLCNSAITPIDKIADNIKRVQKVMSQNQHYFRVDGIWEDKMQKIIYDYLINSGPIEIATIGADPADPENNGKIISDPKSYKERYPSYRTKQVLLDRHHGASPKHHGYHRTIGHSYKSTLYDILGYVDKDAEKWYSSWAKTDTAYGPAVKVKDNIQNVDIYNGLYDL